MLLGILLVLFFCLFAYLSYRNLLWGLILIAAFLPGYLIRFEILNIPLTVLEGMILVVFVIWLTKNIKEVFGIKYLVSRFRKNREWFLAVGLFLLAATVAVFVSPNLRAALGIWKAYFIEPALFFLVLVTTVKSRADAEKIIWGLVLGSLPVALLSIIQKFTGWLIPNPFWAAEETRRVTSVFGYPNAVALYLAPILPFMVYLMEHGAWNMEHKIWKKCFMLCAMCFVLLAIIFTKSTGALLALAAVAVIAGLICKKTRWWTVGAVVLFFLIVPFTSLRQPLGEEILLRGRSGQIRLAMWGETVEMLRAHPIFGAGLAGYQVAVQPYHILDWAEIYLYPHNLFLNFWTETGLLGLVGFFFLVWNFFKLGIRKLFRNPRIIRQLAEVRGGQESGVMNQGLIFAALASTTIILIHGLVDVPYFKNDLAVIFWLLLGIIITL